MRAEAGLGRGEYVTPGLVSKGLTFRNCRRRAGGGQCMEGAAPLRVYSLSPLGSGVLGGSVLSRLDLGGPHLVAPNHIPGFLDPAGL